MEFGPGARRGNGEQRDERQRGDPPSGKAAALRGLLDGASRVGAAPGSACTLFSRL
jgi:hypothetical protein